MVRPPLCLAQEPSLTSLAKPSLSGAAHERCSVKTEAGTDPHPPTPPSPLDLYGAGMWEHFWVALWSRRVLVPVLSSHSAQTPKASSSPAFDLQCRKSGQGKFVPLSSGLSSRFGWQSGVPCPTPPGRCHILPSQCLFQLAISAPSDIPGTFRTFGPTSSKVPGLGKAAGHGNGDTQRLGTSNPPLPLSRAPLRTLAAEHPVR